jgi:hypothetical protein
MPTTKRTWTEMGAELIHKRGEGLGECLREGSKGELPMSIYYTHFPEFYYHCVNLLISD